jgi:hypothetical protein
LVTISRKKKGTIPYILQRINHHVFRDPPRLMENIVRVTGHISKKLESRVSSAAELSRRVFTVIFTQDKTTY